MKLFKRLFLISILVFIFVMSNMNGESSTNSSNFIMMILYRIYRNFSLMNYETFLNLYHNIVRELAHFIEFLVLGIALYINGIDWFKNKIIIKTFFIGLIYAISDEIHQLFVLNRTFEIKDILIDSFGVIVGIVLVYLVINLWKKKCCLEKRH